MKKVTIKQCKDILRDAGKRLPRPGYESYIMRREYDTTIKHTSIFGKVYEYTTPAHVIEDVYLYNYAGRLSVKYYPVDLAHERYLLECANKAGMQFTLKG